MQVSTDITHFLPDSDDQRFAEISRQLTHSELTRTMILSLGTPESSEAVVAMGELSEALQRDPEIVRLRFGPAEGFAEAAYGLLFAHRYQLAFAEPETQWPALTSKTGIAAAALALKQQLTSPAALLVKRLAGADPFLIFPGILDRLSAANAGDLKVVAGHFVTPDGRHAVLFLETRHSPFDGAAQRPLLDDIQRAFGIVNHAHGGRLTLEQSGLNRFAVASEKLIRSDIDRISVLSTLALIVLFLLLFRSLRILLLSFLPLLFGMAAGLAASAALLGEIHGLTLAFGSTLIGVCVDYPIHFLNHHSLFPAPNGPRGTRRRIAWALVLGALTTLAGFVGLALTSFPGMRELAVFASAGILAALGATYWLLPALSAQVPPCVPLHQAFARGAGRVLEILGRRRAPLVALLLIVLALCAVGLPRVRWSDDLSALNRIDPAMRAEDEQVRALVSRMDSGRLVIAVAPDDARALEIDDQVAAALVQAQAAGELQGFGSVHTLVPSAALQARNVTAMRADGALPQQVAAGFTAAGFRPEAFAAFAADLARPPPSALTLAEVLQSPLGDLVRPLRAQLGPEVGLLTLVRGVNAPAALDRRLSTIAGAYYFDQEEFLARTYGRYRRRTLEVVTGGIAVMFAIVFLKYRRLRLMAAAGLPALLAAAATLAVLGLLGVVTSLLHVMSLLFVLSAGEDYAVFLIESAQDRAYLGASAVSIALCCFATVLGFGLLGLSQMPALRAVGLTTGIGVVIALLLAPTALLLVPRTAGAA